MIFQLLKNSDWSFLLDFVSPAFFRIIPPVDLMRNASALAKRTQDEELYQKMLANFALHSDAILPKLRIIDKKLHSRDKVLSSGAVLDFKNCDADIRKQVADTLVALYFSQVLLRKPVFLDVRLSRFSMIGDELHWSPGPLLGVFSEHFLIAMGDVYKGYYGGDQNQMKDALALIGLEWAHDVFMSHFGEGNQSEVKFSLSQFVHTFHEIFVLSKAEKKNLKGEFVQLGVLLGLMYESLEALDVSVDVRSVFKRVLKNLGTDSGRCP